MIRLSAVLAAFLALSAPMQAWADAAGVDLQSVTGPVTLNGKPTAGGSLNVGDLVVTGKAGAGILVFSDGCRVKVDQQSQVKVGSTSPCKAATVEGGGPDATIIIGAVAILGAAGGIAALASGNGASP